MNNSVFVKTIENVRKHRNIKLVTPERRRNDLVSETNYHTTKLFTETLLVMEMRKAQILMNKTVYFGLPILDLSKTVMYELWYDYVKPKYDKNMKLLYGYRYLHCSCKNRRYLQRHCKSYSKKI